MKKLPIILLMILSISVTANASTERNVATRKIDYNSHNSPTIAKYKDTMLSRFNSYNYDNSDSIGKFAGSTILNSITYSKVNLMSTNIDLDHTITETITITVDLETLSFTMNLDYIDGNGSLVKTYQGDVTPTFDPITDDYLITTDHDDISLKKSVIDPFYEECAFVGKDKDLLYEGGGGGIGGLVIVAAIVLAPLIFEIVETLIIEIVQFFESFWNWLVGLFSTTTIETYTTTQDYRYQVKVQNQDYVLERIETQSLTQMTSKHYPAIADSDDKYVYISPIPFSDENTAAGVMAGKTSIPSITNPQNSFLLSNYTVLSSDAYRVAALAHQITNGTYIAYYDGIHDQNGALTGVFFNHYHPGPAGIPGERTPHSFYGAPTIRW